MAGNFKAIGVDQCILSTDLGQVFNPTPAEGFHMMLSYMHDNGPDYGELETLIKINPEKLLGLA